MLITSIKPPKERDVLMFGEGCSASLNTTLRIHSNVAVGFGNKNLNGEEVTDEFLMGAFWERIFQGIQGPLFECYDKYTMLDLVVLTPQEVGFHSGDERIALSSFFSRVVSNFPEMDFVKPEVAFRIHREYQLEIREAHYFAIPQPGVLMREYNLPTRKVGSRLVHCGLRLLGVPHLQKKNAVHRLVQPVPHYDTHWTSCDVKWVFALKPQVETGATAHSASNDECSCQHSGTIGTSCVAEYRHTSQYDSEPPVSRALMEKQMDEELDDVLSFAAKAEYDELAVRER